MSRIKKIFIHVLSIFSGLVALIFIRKRRNRWAFPAHFIQKSFSDNSRAVFEEIKDDASIIKIIFTRDSTIDVIESDHVKIISISGLAYLFKLASCGIVFTQHSLLLDYKISSWLLRYFFFISRYVVNLYHGVPFKYIQNQDKTAVSIKENKFYSLITASSAYDKLVFGCAFSPINFNKIKIFGLPKNDFLLLAEDLLPQMFRSDLEKVKSIKKDKKLILYAPTYRESRFGGDYYHFSALEIAKIKNFAKKHNLIFGFRYHYYVNGQSDFKELIDNQFIFDVGQNQITEVAMLIRESDVVITDYSSLFLDALFLDKKLLGFPYDYNHYKNQQRGLYIDLFNVFPGKLTYEFDELLFSLGQLIDVPVDNIVAKNILYKNLFFDYIDCNNGRRVTDYLKCI